MGTNRTAAERVRPLALVIALFMSAVVLRADPAQATHNLSGMEEYQVSLNNAARETPSQNNAGGQTYGLAFHEGLREQARLHSQYMITVGALNEDNFSTRVATAFPDPSEVPNAPPDNGFDLDVFCGAVARTSPIPNVVHVERSVVEAVYAEWRDNTPTARHCMFDEPPPQFYTVAGAGYAVEEDIEYDPGNPDPFRRCTSAAGCYALWVTLLLVKDGTPPDRVLYPCQAPFPYPPQPGCPGATPTPSPAPTATPTPTPAPSPTPTPTGTPTPTPTPPPPTPTPTPSPVPTPTPTPSPPPSPTPTPEPFCYPNGEIAITVGGFYVWVDGVWQETNGYAGLQRTPFTCPSGRIIPPDLHLIGV